jgi:hypothetical protein
MRRTGSTVLLTVFVVLAGLRARPVAAEPIRFNRDIAPILSNNCFSCHGPDKNKRKADLRLDTRVGLFGKLEEGIPVIPGDPSNSLMVRRIASKDPDEMMPPPKSNKHLSPAQIELLTQWVASGAQWEPHWSFIAPQRPAVPAVRVDGWAHNSIDAFILARLEREGLAPSKEADKTTLIRRVTLDLTGLPPAPKQVDDFLADARADAYERLVDRLLADTHYGERMALDWLDAARYADTHGYHIDAGRDQSRWRQWVIDAFNRNEPFDRFTIEQLAGDLLPGATTEQKIATGFVRNNMVNFEGGAIPEEYRTAYVIDRVNTTGTVFLGLTVGCTQCHDHKFDPMTQKEFYQLFAYFNNVPENGLDGSKGNAAPILSAATPEQQKQLDELSASEAALERQLDATIADVDSAQAQWELSAPTAAAPIWRPLDPTVMTSAGGATLARQDDKSILVTGPNPANDTYTIVAPVEVQQVTALRVEALTEPRLVAGGPGRSANGNAVLTGLKVAAADQADAPVKMRSASADFTQDGFAASSVIAPRPPVDPSRAGWALYPEVGKEHASVFEFEQPLKTAGGTHIAVTLEFKSPYAQHQFGRFRLSVTNAPLPAQAMPGEVARALSVPAANRSDAQRAAVGAYYRENVSPVTRELKQRLALLKKERKEIESALPSTMVMAEMDKPRDAFVLMRGQYDKPGERVTSGVPAFLPPLSLPEGARNDRLALARWLVAPNQPLTARVIVNRYWQSFFGTGIVKTVEDFGTQGEQPSHPELLDWLATQFADGWDVKQMVRLMVTSSTYRQSSAITPEQAAADPENRLLSRGPRFRLPAEFIRDQALAAAGLLDDRIGGASVLPYQPSGLWEELMSRSDGQKWTAQVYQQSHGADLYRRTMYTFWKRTSPPPALATFDAPDREVCTVRRARTNTPLQALVLMNDPTYVEAGRKLAERVMHEGGATVEDRITWAFRLVLARRPSAEESAVLNDLFNRQLGRYRDDKPSAQKLLSVGESPRDESLDVVELAAWANVASVILNLDEAVTRG